MVLSGREKATIFLSILGADASARILRYLPEELADLIASGINHLPTPSTEALAEVVNEFESYLALPGASDPVPMIEEKPKPVQPKRSYAFLMYERPQIAAFLINLLSTPQKEEALQGVSREKDIVEELLNNFKPNSLVPKLQAVLKEQFKERLFL